MPYTNNVPQGNQTIAQTQPLIQANFGFIQTDLQVEHQFNGNIPGQAEGTHIKASMPNIADPVALPAGTNGIYYVSGGLPKFYNGVVNQLIFGNAAFQTFAGIVTILVGATMNITPTINGNIFGKILINRSDSTTGNGHLNESDFFQNGAVNYVVLVGDTTNHITVLWNGGNLAIKNTGSSTYTFNCVGWISAIV